MEKDLALTDLGKVGENLFLVLRQHLRTDGNLDHKIGRARPGLVTALPVIAALRLEMLRVSEVDQRVEALHRLEDDIAALAAIAAIGSAVFDVLLAPETDGPRAASARFQIDLGLVEEMHGCPLCNSSTYCESLEACAEANCCSSTRADKAEDLLVAFVKKVFDAPE